MRHRERAVDDDGERRGVQFVGDGEGVVGERCSNLDVVAFEEDGVPAPPVWRNQRAGSDGEVSDADVDSRRCDGEQQKKGRQKGWMVHAGGCTHRFVQRFAFQKYTTDTQIRQQTTKNWKKATSLVPDVKKKAIDAMKKRNTENLRTANPTPFD